MQSMNKKRPVRRTRMNADQRRESILTVAVEVFAASGYRAGKVSDVAARVGVTEPVIFQNFGSKAALYAAVLDRVAADMRAHMQDLVEHYGSTSELLAHVMGPSNVGHLHAPGFHGVLFADAAALIAEPALAEAARRSIGAVADHLADIVRHGQVDGEISADLDPDAAAWLLLSVLAMRPVRTAVTPDREHLEDGVAALAIQALVTPSRARGSDKRSDRRGHAPPRPQSGASAT